MLPMTWAARRGWPLLGKIHRVKVHAQPQVLEDADGAVLRHRAADGSYYLSSGELRQAQAQGLSLDVLEEIEEDALPVQFFLPHDGAVNDPPPQSARLAVLSRLLAEGRATGEVHIRFLGRNRSVPADGFVLDQAGGQRCYVWQVVPGDELLCRPELRERFSALRGHLGDPDRRVVLSLGSGGLKLFSHAVVLRLLETIGAAEHVDEVWGSSGGALVALLYCHGLSPHAIEQTGYDVYSGRFHLQLRPSTFQMVRHLLRDAIMPRDDLTAAGFVDCADALQRMLAQYCSEQSSQRPFYCTAFNLATRRTEVLTPAPVPAHLNELIRQVGARDAALASSAVPLLFVPRAIAVDGEIAHYIDGSTTEGVPMHSPVRKWDLDREAGRESRRRLTILSVKLTGASHGHHPSGRMSKLRLLQTIASVGIEEIHQRDCALLELRDDVELLPLELADPIPDFFDIDRIPECVRLAKENFPEQLARIEERLRET